MFQIIKEVHFLIIHLYAWKLVCMLNEKKEIATIGNGQRIDQSYTSSSTGKVWEDIRML